MIAAEVRSTRPDFGHLEPMIDRDRRRELAAAGITTRRRSCSPTPATGTASRWTSIDRAAASRCSIPPDAGKRKGARPGWDGGLYAFMRRVLETDRGGELYAKRQRMIEPIFADTKFNRGIDRFQRRGRSAARSEWRLITATHNLLKLHRHQLRLAGP